MGEASGADHQEHSGRFGWHFWATLRHFHWTVKQEASLHFTAASLKLCASTIGGSCAPLLQQPIKVQKSGQLHSDLQLQQFEGYTFLRSQPVFGRYPFIAK